MLIPRRSSTYLLLSCTAMGLSLRASLSCDCTHLIPLLRISLLFSISVSGKCPSFLKIMLKQRPNTQSPTRTTAAMIISI